jgi:[ribosomal protein S18]-alanine N-acetyltransferase
VLVRKMTLADCDALEPAKAELALGIDPRVELGRDLTRAWVACDPGSETPLGYALGWWLIDELELVAVATVPAARRRGVARALLRHAISAATLAGALRVLLEVGHDNTAAIRLYEGAGFRVFNVRRNYYQKTQEDALEMELALPQPAREI